MTEDTKRLWAYDEVTSRFFGDVIRGMRESGPLSLFDEVSVRFVGRRSAAVMVTFNKALNLNCDLMTVGYEIEMIVRQAAHNSGIERMKEAKHSRANLTLMMDDDQVELGFYFSDEDTPRVGDDKYQGLA